ncbi:MAG: Nin1 binding protein [Phylliscum demangeonii]|nr:MAG: Nin1 binding protein [Phylliscum demangeonii]
MASLPGAKAVHTIVLDAGPLLQNEPSISSLLAQAEVLLTVPAVLAEIRDAVARARIELTWRPFLTVRDPKPASVKCVADFARLTGDYEVLSRTDLLVLALAYEVECERNEGGWRLRRVPGQARINGPAPAPQRPPGAEPGAGEAEVEEEEEGRPLPAMDDGCAAKSEGDAGLHQGDPTQKTDPDRGKASTALDQPSAEIRGLDRSLATLTLSPETPPPPPLDPSDNESDGWITPSNIQKHLQHAHAGPSSSPRTAGARSQAPVLQVATLTTDYAMQNVLLQMNLNLLSGSLQRIRYLKSFILRCHACFARTKDMSKQFCARCGLPTLRRVSCSTSAAGEFRIHLKKHMQFNTRGDRYSIPKLVPGSANTRVNAGGGGKGGGQGGWGQALLLAEDQKEYQRAVRDQERVTRTMRDLMDEDHLPALVTGARGRTGAAGRLKIGAGRNVNARKRK